MIIVGRVVAWWRARRRTPSKVCRYCGSTSDLTVEHLTPRARGGTDRRSNLGTSCRPCNLDKDCLLDAEYQAVRTNPAALHRLRQHQQARLRAANPPPPARRLAARSPLAARTLPAARPLLVQRIPPPVGGWPEAADHDMG